MGREKGHLEIRVASPNTMFVGSYASSNPARGGTSQTLEPLSDIRSIQSDRRTGKEVLK